MPRESTIVRRPLKVTFSGSVPASSRPLVEALFYFNVRQGENLDAIRRTVEETGPPRIVEQNASIWIDLPSGTSQCLFACAPATKPVGVALYSRPEPSLIRILHMAVETGDQKNTSREVIAGLLVQEVRQISVRINGVSRLQLPYRRNSFLKLR